MKIIMLLQAAMIGDVLRQPIECPLTVSDDVADHLLEAGLLAVEPEDVPEEARAAKKSSPARPPRPAA